ncbi:MAG: ATP-binding protein [Chlamydiia bacterium]|nr:ATP-binding protein [Chlamydiia bacterium]
MSYVPQNQIKKVLSLLKPGKVLVLYGPRRVGKTTLVKKVLEHEPQALFVTGEDLFVQRELSSQSIEKLKAFIGEHDLLVIDEAQYVPEIGLNLKLIVDHLPSVRVLATGSSTFDLANQVGEPLTGRKYTIKLFPLSQIELSQIETTASTQAHLKSRLLYGAYPEVVLMKGDHERRQYLQELVSSYLLKDILAFEGIKKSKKLLDLLILLALQVGSEVSHTELASKLGMNKGTVEKYLDLLEQVFILINLRGFSRNLRKEVTKTSKYYFYDNGVRNALINNFNPFPQRNDTGALWENYLVMERLKKQAYTDLYSNNYFWRTYDQKEIDWVEERDGNLFAYEFKWNHSKPKPPKLWQGTYPKAHWTLINQENYLPFIA